MKKQTTKSVAHRTLKLRIELIPKPLWDRNLRSSEGLGKGRWDKLLRQLMKAQGPRCAICGAIGEPLHGHEVWGYREKKTIGTAMLLRVEIVCVDCHDIHHWARTTKIFEAGDVTAERYRYLRHHFRTINGCRQEVFDDHFLQSTRIWEERSQKRWKIDWGEFVPLVEQAKAARGSECVGRTQS